MTTTQDRPEKVILLNGKDCIAGCGSGLTGRQTKFCSKSCSDRYKFAAKWPACTRCSRPNKRGGRTKICNSCFLESPQKSKRLLEAPLEKFCSMCRELKPASEYYRNNGRPDWLSVYCKGCWGESEKARYDKSPDRGRAYRIKTRYGLTLEEYQQLWDAQDGKCAMCGKEESGKTRFHIDHSHEDGLVRALLCYKCNKTLVGSLTLESARAIVAYLENPPAVAVLGYRVVPENQINPTRKKRRRKNRLPRGKKR